MKMGKMYWGNPKLSIHGQFAFPARHKKYRRRIAEKLTELVPEVDKLTFCGDFLDMTITMRFLPNRKTIDDFTFPEDGMRTFANYLQNDELYTVKPFEGNNDFHQILFCHKLKKDGTRWKRYREY